MISMYMKNNNSDVIDQKVQTHLLYHLALKNSSKSFLPDVLKVPSIKKVSHLNFILINKRNRILWYLLS